MKKNYKNEVEELSKLLSEKNIAYTVLTSIEITENLDAVECLHQLKVWGDMRYFCADGKSSRFTGKRNGATHLFLLPDDINDIEELWGDYKSDIKSLRCIIVSDVLDLDDFKDKIGTLAYKLARKELTALKSQLEDLNFELKNLPEFSEEELERVFYKTEESNTKIGERISEIMMFVRE